MSLYCFEENFIIYNVHFLHVHICTSTFSGEDLATLTTFSIKQNYKPVILRPCVKGFTMELIKGRVG